MTNKLNLFGVCGDSFDGFTLKDVSSQMMAFDTEQPIQLSINSPGGFVDEGLGVYNLLKAWAPGVDVMVEGVAASMGSLIAMAGKSIVMRDASFMMIHHPMGIQFGNAEAHRKTAEQLDFTAKLMARVYANRSKAEYDSIWSAMSAETWYSSEDAVTIGLADSIDTAPAAAAAMVRPLSFAHLTQSKKIPSVVLERFAGQAAAVAVTDIKETPVSEVKNTPADDDAAKKLLEETKRATAEAITAERSRTREISRIGIALEVDPVMITKWIDEGVTIDDARSQAIDLRAEEVKKKVPSQESRIQVLADATDKARAGMTAWLITKAGVVGMVGKAFPDLPKDPGEFRGMTMVDIARDCLERAGIRTRGMSRMDMVGQAITQTTSDFPIILENVLNKTLVAAYDTTPDAWTRFCAIGQVSDFRPYPRYRLGTFGVLDPVTEAGEFKNKSIPDAEKASIQASTKGNIINLSRQSIINDDMGAFNRLATMFGRAARLTIEVDVFALFALNSGAGPTMADGNPLFHTGSHVNIDTTSAVVSVAAFDSGRVKMAQQRDPSSNEYLSLVPTIWLGPITYGGNTRVINGALYDPDTPNKLQRPNMVNGMIKEIVDTPRLTGTAWYLLADPAVAPVFEVVFLDGQQSPFLDNQLGFRIDGVEWKVRLDYGVGAIDWRGAVKNAGA